MNKQESRLLLNSLAISTGDEHKILGVQDQARLSQGELGSSIEVDGHAIPLSSEEEELLRQAVNTSIRYSQHYYRGCPIPVMEGKQEQLDAIALRIMDATR